MRSAPWRLERLAGVAAIVFLAIGCALVLRPFFSAILWAAILVFCTWPAFAWLERALDHRVNLAAGVATSALAAAFVAPLALSGVSLADEAPKIARAVSAAIEQGPPPPPEWLNAIPMFGDGIKTFWLETIRSGAQMAELIEPYMATLGDWALNSGLTIGNGVMQLSIAVFISFFLFRDGRGVAEAAGHLADSIGGEQGRALVKVAAGTVQGVVYGIIGTAIAQGALAWIGFMIAGVPGALVWGLVTTVLSVLPVGAPLVWIPAAIWLFAQGDIAWSVFMAVWGFFVVSSVDNFLRPYLISRGSDLPFILVFLGVLGGVFAFGFLGIFLGPTLLAVGHALLREWIASSERAFSARAQHRAAE